MIPLGDPTFDPRSVEDWFRVSPPLERPYRWQKWLLCAVAAAMALPVAAEARPRKWTDRSGRFSVRADLIEVKDDQVVLKRPDGKTISVPLERLSRPDQDFVVGIKSLAGWSVQAKAAASAIHDPQVQAKAYTGIAIAQARMGDIAGANHTADAIAGAGEKERAYFGIAEGLAQVGNVQGVKDAVAAINDPVLKLQAQAEVALAQAHSGDIAAAKSTADAIRNPIVQAGAYMEIAHLQATKGDISGATQTAEAMERFKDMVLPAIVGAQAQAGDTDGAKATLETIQNRTMKLNATIAMALAQAKAGDKSGALETIESARVVAEGIRAPKQQKRTLYDQIVVARAKAGDVAGAKAMANSVLYSSPSQMALWGIASAQADAGDIAGAQETAASLSDDSLKAGIFLAIASVQAKKGSLGAAQKNFNLAKNAATTLRNAPWENHIYRGISNAWGKAGDWVGLQDWIKSLEQPTEIVLVYLGAIDALVHLKSNGQMMKLP